MRLFFLSTLMALALSHCIGQGIFAGGITFNVNGTWTDAHVTTLTKDIRPNIIMDWGDGSSDTVQGTNLMVGAFVFLNEYSGYHHYPDTGYYYITYTDSSWIPEISNFEDSGHQIFELKAGFFKSNDQNFVNNHSPYIGVALDQIYNINGVIVYDMPTSDFDGGDSIVPKLIPVPAPNYFLPDATDSLVCCLIWDRPTAPGKYAFGFEVEEWRYGQKMGSIQRFITVQVDSIYSGIEVVPNTGSKFFIYPNPANNYLEINMPESMRNASLSLYTTTSQPVLTQSLITGSNNVALETLAPGIYFYEVRDEGRVLQTGKLVKLE